MLHEHWGPRWHPLFLPEYRIMTSTFCVGAFHFMEEGPPIVFDSLPWMLWWDVMPFVGYGWLSPGGEPPPLGRHAPCFTLPLPRIEDGGSKRRRRRRRR